MSERTALELHEEFCKLNRNLYRSLNRIRTHEQFMLVLEVEFEEARPLFEDGYERQRAYHMLARIRDELTRSEWNV